MINMMYFYKCDVCDQIVAASEELNNPLSCCNRTMELLVPGSSDGAVEKHVPVYSLDGHKLTVSVGVDPHPMMEEHYIEWICVVTCCRVLWMPLEPGMPPVAYFRIGKREKVKAIYAYCNIHELWVNMIEEEEM